VQISVSDGGDLGRVVRDLRKHMDGKALKRGLTTALRAELKPAVMHVKAAYRSGPSRAQTGRMRRALARATAGKVQTGRNAVVSIAVQGRKMPSGMGRIPRLYEGEGRWRHPLWGNRDFWYAQRSHPTFYHTLRPHISRVHRRVDDVVSDVTKKITKG